MTEAITEMEEFSIFDKKFYPDDSSIPQISLDTPSGVPEIPLFSSLAHSHSSPSRDIINEQKISLEGSQFWPTSKPIRKNNNTRYSTSSLRNSKFTKKNFWKKVWNKLSHPQDSPSASSATDGSKFFVVIKSKRRGSDQSSSNDGVISLSTTSSIFRNSPTPTSTLTAIEDCEDDHKSILSVSSVDTLASFATAPTYLGHETNRNVMRSRYHSISYAMRHLKHPSPTPDERISRSVRGITFYIHVSHSIHFLRLNPLSEDSNLPIPVKIPRDLSFSQFQNSMAGILNLKPSESKELVGLYHTKRLNLDDTIRLDKAIEKEEEGKACHDYKEIISELVKSDKLWIIDCDQVWRIGLLFWKQELEMTVVSKEMIM
ncbi:7751_t:CDS:1 [Acaulospora morrowiae]|uniref:7751_t:CDS:1 n=1 Tax=Acaulospora morrowiae TaxID=94023 RepID=A0A9N8ZEM2_9GLOM|nr:7751_t:CDS:1 [Acaulospora morrowiae]